MPVEVAKAMLADIQPEAPIVPSFESIPTVIPIIDVDSGKPIESDGVKSSVEEEEDEYY